MSDLTNALLNRTIEAIKVITNSIFISKVSFLFLSKHRFKQTIPLTMITFNVLGARCHV